MRRRAAAGTSRRRVDTVIGGSLEVVGVRVGAAGVLLGGGAVVDGENVDHASREIQVGGDGVPDDLLEILDEEVDRLDGRLRTIAREAGESPSRLGFVVGD